MNKLCIMLVTTFIVIVNLKVNKCNVSSEDDLFHTMNIKLYNTSRENKTLIESNKTILLLTMRENLNKLTEKNLKSYKDIKNAIKNSDIDAVNYLNKLNDVIKELLEDKHVKANRNISDEKLNKIEENESIEINDTSIESLQFFKKFLNTLNEETSEDMINSIIKPVHKNKNIRFSEFRKSKRNNTYNLKLWIPSNSNGVNRRICDGKIADIRKYPFIVSVHVMDEFMGTGSIISKDLIITAASCLLSAYNHKNDKLGDITVRAGSHYTNRGGERMSITDVYFHPIFDPAFLLNNLAIARIKTKFPFMNNRRRIRRIQYAWDEGQTLSSIKMMGWGIADGNIIARNHEKLLSSELDIYKLQPCQEMYSRHYVTSKNFCAGFTTKGSGACKRDVGGPGVVGGVLVGVVSFGPPVCGTPGAPTVFTKLGYYVNWIDSVVKKSAMRSFNVSHLDHVGAEKKTNYKKNKTTVEPTEAPMAPALEQLQFSGTRTPTPIPTYNDYNDLTEATKSNTSVSIAYLTRNAFSDLVLTRMEHIENLFMKIILEKGDILRNDGKHTMLMGLNSAFTLTTKAMTKEIATKNSDNDKEDLGNSDNYEVEENSQGLSIEQEVTQLENGIGSTKSIAISTLYKEIDSDGSNEMLNRELSKETVLVSDAKTSKNRIRQIKSDLRVKQIEKKPGTKQLNIANKINNNSDKHEASVQRVTKINNVYDSYDSADEKVLISRTMPKKDDPNYVSDKRSEEQSSHDTRTRSILDYINIFR